MAPLIPNVGGEWLVSRSDRFKPGQTAFGTQCIRLKRGRKGTFRPAHETVTDTEWHTYTRYIDTIDSPDDEHEVARNM